MKSTAEQLPIIEYQGNHLVVKAYAGCGKTTTLVAYANHHSHLRMLYLAYNRAIRDEGGGEVSEKRSVQDISPVGLAAIWPTLSAQAREYPSDGCCRAPQNTELGRCSRRYRCAQCLPSSADNEISEAHYFAALSEEDAAEHGADHLDRTINSAQKLWDEMIDTESKFPCQHDAYLKLFQLSNPQLPYDVILFDEAQDSNPVTASLVAGQKARKVFVGDKWQQIYRWRGAENALDTQIVQGAASMFLTNSFRFGPMIAGVANAILKQQGETRPLVGFGARDKVTTSLPSGCNHYTVLNRTVIGVIMTAIDAVSDGQVVYWNGGIEAYQISDLEDVYHLKVGRKDEIRNKRLFGQFSDFGGFAEAAEESKDAEMNRMLRILKEHNDIPKLIAALRRNSTDDPLDADVIVSTCHRSKGLEWDVVVLEEDFPDIFDEEKITPDQRVDELNLLYVAATRAKKVLVINSITQVVIQKSHAEAKREMEAAAGQRA